MATPPPDDASQNPAHRAIMQALDWAYDKAVSGLSVPGISFDSAEELAADYAGEETTLHDRARSLVNWQVARCATTGFVTNLGGLITLPVAIPANLGAVLYVQIRMVAAVAHMGAFDLRDDRVKTFCLVCLTGNGGAQVLKTFGVKLGQHATRQLIARIPFEVIKAINRAVGMRLITKAGEKGVVVLARGVPLVGGLVAGGIDGVTTKTIGSVAMGTFLPPEG